MKFVECTEISHSDPKPLWVNLAHVVKIYERPEQILVGQDSVGQAIYKDGDTVLSLVIEGNKSLLQIKDPKAIDELKAYLAKS